MRLAFLGTPDFAVQSLAAILAAGHEVACVYSQPPAPRGRGQTLQPSPVPAFAEAHGLPRVQTIQNEDNLLRRDYDLALAELAYHEDIGLLAYSPLAAGAISGKYLGGVLPPGTRGAVAGSSYRNNQYTEPAIRAYIELAKQHGLDVNQMAIAFCLTKPFMTSVIIGATTMEQLQADIASADVTLGKEVLDGIQGIFMKYARTL